MYEEFRLMKGHTVHDMLRITSDPTTSSVYLFNI
jgi:hypothetical protein